MLRLKMKPSTVRRFPCLVDSDLPKAKMKIGAIMIAGPQWGMKWLALVDMNMPNPRTNHTRGRYSLLFALFAFTLVLDAY
jgi:hypothetical protein